ncbi:MAG: scramblase [Candidatus Omnitrophica bacterium]|nr:scramblase [Candidatus Omnitrophota bacterium]
MSTAVNGDGGGETFIISQKKDWGEIVLGYETCNQYVITELNGAVLYYAAEIKGSFIFRSFLRAKRPFTVDVLDVNNNRVISMSRPFCWWLSTLTVYDDAGEKLGFVKQCCSLLQRKYIILDRASNAVFEITGPLWHQWIFTVKQNKTSVGTIVKKWAGLGSEALTDVDNFALTLSSSLDETEKKLIIGAVFLIDFVHFEK